eukprot:Blabericola_migrator_1__46@NODE_1010_length_5714_cov_79_058438_g693_i0_p4_GENE_NODE_1010_length_5714_cov_79_058438_g693_i0NODE_1010_length_5714_cov_79_058438_g693_i0_p4_ORF_typecomplete_len247_score35_51VATC/PF18716_1/2_5e12_NODE_1010_length_5714_cov_79_058438_g693_i013462086
MALIQIGHKTNVYGFIKFGFIGCVQISDENLSELRVACHVASRFKPIPPLVVASFAGCVSDETVRQALALVSSHYPQSRIAVFVPAHPKVKAAVLQSPFLKLLTANPMYDFIDPTGIHRCDWPNEPCVSSYKELASLLTVTPGTRYVSTGVYFQKDHSPQQGLTLKQRLELLFELDAPLAPASIFDFDWMPPVSRQETEARFECDVCHKFYPLKSGDEPFRKFDFVYCSTACLATHRKANWEPVLL